MIEKTTSIIIALLLACLLMSCSESNLGTAEVSGQLSVGEAVLQSQNVMNNSPEKVSAAFFEMVEKVQKMSREEIEALNDEEILKLGEPIRHVAEGTIQLSERALQQLLKPSREMEERFRTMTPEEHKALSREIEQIINPYDGFVHERRSFSVGQIKKILLGINDDPLMASSSTCESLFHVQSGYVHLYPGDNLNTANDVCPAGSIFYVHSGTHTGQTVNGSKNGNLWVGVGGIPVIDGQNNTNRAFNGGMHNNSISWMEIRNYSTHGIYTVSGSNDGIAIKNMTFKNIAPNQDGQEHGAVMIISSEDIEVSNSYFEDVASSIRIRNSEGPIKVLDNEALNTGRNFFQCGNCTGDDIRINGNSLDRTTSYGSAVLEDWISIYESEGTSSSWIQVKNNRARGHDGSQWGSFLILGDDGGKYQEAAGNIGVNPGQVGIGAAGGHDMKVEDNKMYSEQWTHSNVAFFSAKYSSTCGNHNFPASPANVANWTNKDGILNRAWSDGNCGISNTQIRNNVDEDTNMDESIWNDW